jgi:NAD(P)-dependent dehydrogenase (short-subunit alcohol dehydrogenase family)
MSTLAGKVAIVTGGSRGIGLAVASALIARGARVVVTGTNEQTLAAAARSLGDAAIPVRADVRRYADVEALMQAASVQAGGFDILVNNAGVGAFAPVADLSLDDWDRVIGTNLTGVFYCCKAGIPHLRARGGGWIINVSSLISKNPAADSSVYGASKAALNFFTESLMQEVRHDGIRVAYVLPGSVRTEFMGRTQAAADDWKVAPEDVAQVIVDLVSHEARALPSRVEIRPARPPKKG